MAITVNELWTAAAPRALLVVTLAGSLFTDTANELVVQTFLSWFGN